MLSIAVGLISGFETLGSNAFGAKQYYLLGLYFHRTQLVGYLFVSVMLIIHFFTCIPILTLFNLDENVLKFAEMYIRITMFFILADVQFSVNFRYLNIIGKPHINLIILIMSILLHPLWCYIMIVYFNLGIQGAGVSIIISQSLNAILGGLYILIVNPNPESIFFFNKDSFLGWWEYLKIALPSAFLMCAEWWGFEVMAIVAIWIGKLDYTVHVLSSNISGLFVTTCIGFGMSATILVGKSISVGNINLVKKYTKFTLIFGVTIQTVAALGLLIFKRKIIGLFINDEEVIDKGADVMALISLITIFDHMQTIMNCVFRGLGKQLIASLVAFCNFYVVQGGLSIVFGKVLGMGVFGIWLAVLVGSSCASLFYFILYLNFDLELIKKQTRDRLDKDHSIIHEKLLPEY